MKKILIMSFILNAVLLNLVDTPQYCDIHKKLDNCCTEQNPFGLGNGKL
ncbi:hypothetical protein C815_01187 [Firmicutes bacterium M10-2]|nr:hypothetical protein C815_01187 [Firmicutes bacterium M10-2]